MKMKLIAITVLLTLAYGLSSCSEEDDDITPDTPPSIVNDTTVMDTTTMDTIKTKTEMLAKRWIVDKAYVNVNTIDNSSKGLILDVRSNGTYTLISTGYLGTWEFEANETKINWDKGTQVNQVFTLLEFTDVKINATFKSAFTGQNARWIMIPK